MSPVYDGKLLNLDLILTVFGVAINLAGTVEILDIRKKVNT